AAALAHAAAGAGFALLGRFAQRGRFWAFAVGAAVYALDGLIVLAWHDWVGLAIHTAALVMIVRGLDAGRRLS
ncbi:MAG: MFS transporter, partial [Candidatus Rokuibacteriota bacterium]